MEKTAQIPKDKVNYWYLRQLGIGAGTGVATAAALGLIHSIRAGMAERALAKKKTDTDEDTIVLTLPPKTSEISGGACKQVKDTEGPVTKHGPKLYSKTPGKQQHRDVENGHFGNKVADVSQKPQGEWKQWVDDFLRTWTPEPTASPRQIVYATLLKGLGATGGFIAANSAYNAYRDYYLNKELNKAKKEYIDQSNPSLSKISGFVEKAFGFEDVRRAILVKHAAGDESWLNNLKKGLNKDWGALVGDKITAGIILAFLGTTGGTAYLTKRILDAQTKKLEGDSMTFQPPKVNRIIFRTLPPSTDSAKQPLLPAGVKEQPLTQEETNQVKAAFWIIHDVVSGRNILDKLPALAPVFKKHGTSVEKIAKFLDKAPDVDVLGEDLKQNLPPEVADAVVREVSKSDWRAGMVSKLFGPDSLMNGIKRVMPPLSEMQAVNFDPKAIAEKIKAGPHYAKLIEGITTDSGTPIADWRAGATDQQKNRPAGEAIPEAMWHNEEFGRKVVNTGAAMKGNAAYGLANRGKGEYSLGGEIGRYLAYDELKSKLNKGPGSTVAGSPTSGSADQIPEMPTGYTARGTSRETATPMYDMESTKKNYPDLFKKTWYGSGTASADPVADQSKFASLIVPVVKSAQLNVLSDLMVSPVYAEPDYERNENIAQRATGKVRMVPTDTKARQFLSPERQAIIMAAIQQTIEEELAKRPPVKV